MINTITLQGRLVREPELRTTGSGTSVASFTIACDRDFGEKQVDFIDCVAWRQTGEFVSKYFNKGNMILLTGRLQSRKWEKDGNKHTAWEVVADHVYFGESKQKAPNVEFTELPDDGEGLPF